MLVICKVLFAFFSSFLASAAVRQGLLPPMPLPNVFAGRGEFSGQHVLPFCIWNTCICKWQWKTNLQYSIWIPLITLPFLDALQSAFVRSCWKSQGTCLFAQVHLYFLNQSNFHNLKTSFVFLPWKNWMYHTFCICTVVFCTFLCQCRLGNKWWKDSHMYVVRT